METRKREVTHVPPGEGKTFWMMGADLVTFKASGEDTGGEFAFFDSLVLPQEGSPPHIHHREAESFYVLDGEFEFLKEGGTINATAGSFVHVPKGALHTFKNVGTAPGRLLTLVVPAGLDRFFEEVGEPGADVSPPPGPPDIEKVLAVASEYGIEVPPPQ